MQGALHLLAELEAALAEITGFAAVTLQPSAGAHGELTGMLIIRAHHLAQGDAAQPAPEAEARERLGLPREVPADSTTPEKKP